MRLDSGSGWWASSTSPAQPPSFATAHRLPRSHWAELRATFHAGRPEFFLRGAKAERGSMVRPPPPSSPPSARGHASALRAWLRRRGGGHWLLPAPWREGRRGCHSRDGARHSRDGASRSEEHTSELQSLMRISYAVF